MAPHIPTTYTPVIFPSSSHENPSPYMYLQVLQYNPIHRILRTLTTILLALTPMIVVVIQVMMMMMMKKKICWKCRTEKNNTKCLAIFENMYQDTDEKS